MESSERNFGGGIGSMVECEGGTQGTSAIWLGHLGEVMSETGREFCGREIRSSARLSPEECQT